MESGVVSPRQPRFTLLLVLFELSTPSTKLQPSTTRISDKNTGLECHPLLTANAKSVVFVVSARHMIFNQTI